MKGTELSSKSHFFLLDALRSVAALIVIWYHCYEGFAASIATQGCNHGYLAADFFFILSGFVMLALFLNIVMLPVIPGTGADVRGILHIAGLDRDEIL